MWRAEKNFKIFVCAFAWLWCKYFSQKTSLSRCALGSRAQNRQKPISKLFLCVFFMANTLPRRRRRETPRARTISSYSSNATARPVRSLSLNDLFFAIFSIHFTKALRKNAHTMRTEHISVVPLHHILFARGHFPRIYIQEGNELHKS